jgi:hypothetical protein
MTEFSLALTTRIKPAKQFTVDSIPYDLLGVDHLSPDDEAETMALFARYGVLQVELDTEKNVTKGTPLALALKATRITLLTKLTSMPREVAGRLPLTQQVKLLEAIQAEVEDDEDEAQESAADGGSES